MGVTTTSPTPPWCGCGGHSRLAVPQRGGFRRLATFVWRRCDGFVVVMAWIYGGGDGGEAAAVGDESGKGVSWWDGADVMVTAVERE
ncbi:hypothetical protein Tco_1137241 [Tanacetum coccineum]